MSNSPGLHLKIAEWMLERGHPLSAYDVSKKFEITLQQAMAFLTILEKDNAIETQKGHVIPVTCCNSYRRNIRTIKVISIDREKIAQRRHHYNTYRHYPLKSTSNLSFVEKWERVIRNAGRRKK
ncbi:TPA: hypothetical protein N2G38_002233 [Salmonella enterica]|nr:hypothetical protein [Salmonella enterica]